MNDHKIEEVLGQRGKAKKLMESPTADREGQRDRHRNKYGHELMKGSKNGTCLRDRHTFTPEARTTVRRAPRRGGGKDKCHIHAIWPCIPGRRLGGLSRAVGIPVESANGNRAACSELVGLRDCKGPGPGQAP